MVTHWQDILVRSWARSSAQTADCLSVEVRTIRCDYRMPSRENTCTLSPGIQVRSKAWRSARMAAHLPVGAMMERCFSGILRSSLPGAELSVRHPN